MACEKRKKETEEKDVDARDKESVGRWMSTWVRSRRMWKRRRKRKMMEKTEEETINELNDKDDKGK